MALRERQKCNVFKELNVPIAESPIGESKICDILVRDQSMEGIIGTS